MATCKSCQDYSPEGVRAWMDGYGRTAYEAYSRNAQGLTFDGRPMPDWNDLTDAVQNHWIMAALTVVAAHVGRTHA